MLAHTFFNATIGVKKVKYFVRGSRTKKGMSLIGPMQFMGAFTALAHCNFYGGFI